MTDTQSKDILQEGLAAMGLTLDCQAQERLLAYCAELLRWNARINLFERRDLLTLLKPPESQLVGCRQFSLF